MSDELGKKSVRPQVYFSSITFSDGTVVELEHDDVVVFVGPNNAGKSAALRELHENVSRVASRTVIKEVKIFSKGTEADLRTFLEENALKTGDIANISYSGIGYNIHSSHLSFMNNPNDKHPLASFFSTRLSTETRLTMANAAGPLGFFRDPPTHPIHLLLMDELLTERISKLFRRAYEQDLIPFRGGGSNYPLHVGTKPELIKGKDELSREFIEKFLANTHPLQEQGDGMRSFCAILLYIIATSHQSIQFLDEPEAFLHPPQARLIGEIIARERTMHTQLFIATHSSDILRGLASAGDKRIRIIRIQRNGSINSVKELPREKTAAIVSDTLSQFSRVLEGVFHRHVFVCESDADCLFYSAMMGTISVSEGQAPDALFIYGGGKQRISKLVETLRLLGVPVSAIVDIDILRDGSELRSLYEVFGGDWSEISGDHKALVTAITERRAPLSASQVKQQVIDLLAEVVGQDPFPKNIETAIKRVFQSVSPWDEVKRSGRSTIPGGQAVQQFDRIASKCSGVGLWIVPVGELEGFCRSIEASHGPRFAETVVQERDLEKDMELQDARSFLKSVWDRAKKGG